MPSVQPAENAPRGPLILGRYRAVRLLARGGMGEVHLGRVEGAAGFAKPVVIKTVIAHLDRDPEIARLFAREARILGNLQHPNVVGVLDFGEDKSSYVMVLEYVHGYDLNQWLRYLSGSAQQFEVADAVYVLCSVLDALAYAHALSRPDGTPLGIVHRDISPANILIDVQGQIKLHDFGIARIADDEFKTQDGTFRGTLPYMAPEMLHGAKANALVDLYACGVVLYQLIAGFNPFRGSEPAQTLQRILTHEPPTLRRLRSEVPLAVDAAVQRAIAKDPELRFQDARGFADALRATLDSGHDSTFIGRVRRDFLGAMPKTLGLESLEVRDAAWRAAQDAPEERHISLSSSPPAQLTPTSEAATVAGLRVPPLRECSPTVAAAPLATLLVAKRDASLASLPSSDTSGRTVPAAELAVRSEKRARSLPYVVVAAGAIATIATAAAVSFFVSQRSAAPTSPKFLLIEPRAADPAAAGATLPPPAEASSATAADSSSVAAPSTSSATAADSSSVASPSPSDETSGRNTMAKTPPKISANSLSGAFQRQQGRIGNCFRDHGSPSGDAQVSVRFHVDGAGAVESAQVIPESIGNTALGSCISAIARSTKFPSDGQPIVFSIPIAARRVP